MAIGKKEVSSVDGALDLLKTPKKLMKKLGLLTRKYLDADIKVLLKAKYLDDSLEVTDDGFEFLAAFLFMKNKKELADEVRAQLEEEKKDKKGKRDEDED